MNAAEAADDHMSSSDSAISGTGGVKITSFVTDRDLRISEATSRPKPTSSNLGGRFTTTTQPSGHLQAKHSQPIRRPTTPIDGPSRAWSGPKTKSATDSGIEELPPPAALQGFGVERYFLPLNRGAATPQPKPLEPRQRPATFPRPYPRHFRTEACRPLPSPPRLLNAAPHFDFVHPPSFSTPYPYETSFVPLFPGPGADPFVESGFPSSLRPPSHVAFRSSSSPVIIANPTTYGRSDRLPVQPVTRQRSDDMAAGFQRVSGDARRYPSSSFNRIENRTPMSTILCRNGPQCRKFQEGQVELF